MSLAIIYRGQSQRCFGAIYQDRLFLILTDHYKDSDFSSLGSLNDWLDFDGWTHLLYFNELIEKYGRFNVIFAIYLYFYDEFARRCIDAL